MNDEPAFDPSALDKLETLGGPAFVIEMVDLFLQYAPTRLAAANEALASGDLGGVADAVHPLKTSSGHVGARRTHELAKQTERFARDQQRELLSPLVGQLQAAYLEAKPLLEAARAARA